nr:reverse transcriptase domain-containing protein [Tanacetum cinerariifolium]
MVRALLLDKKNQYSAPTSSPTSAPIKAVEPNCVTCGAPIQPTVAQSESETLVSKPVVAPVSAPMPDLKPSIPYPSRRDNERRRDQANEQIEKFYEIFKDMSFEISFTDALILMPKFASTLKALIGNKEKLSEMAKTPMNEHCSAIILNKLSRKLGDPRKFLIPCEFPGMDECLALADLGASINLMPLSVWKGLLLPELTPTCMTLELVDRSVSKPIGIAKDVSVKTGRALINVHKGELTLRIKNEAITYNLDQTSRYSANYDQMTANKIDVTDEACEEYSQEVLSFSDVTTSGSPTPSDDPIISNTSPTLTPFGDSDFLLLEEADAFLSLEDDPDSPKLDPSYYDPEGNILLLEAILNSDPSPPLPNHEQFVPSFKNELKACEAKMIKSSIDEPPEVELKDLPPHLEYAFLEGDNKFPVIIAKELKNEEKPALIKVLKSHKRAIAWKLSDIQEVEKLLDAGLIYPISDSPWVSPVHCVSKKGGFTVVANEENELILTRLVTGWRRLVGNEYYCFLDGFSGYFQIPIDPCDQEKTTFTCPYGTLAYRHMPFGLCNAPGTFQRCMLAIFSDMVEKTMEVFMDDFSVFGNSFENCLSCLDKMLQRCEDTKLCLNWEKSHFMVKEGIVLGHRISKNRIEVDKAKIDVIAKLLHPTTVKGVWSFLGYAGFYRRFIKDFSKISRPMTHLLEKDTPFIFFEDCINAFQTLKKKLTEASILIAPNWDLPFKLMCDASDFAIGAVLGQHREKHFRPIHYASKTLIDAESNYTTTEKEMLTVVYAFEKFRSCLIMNKCIVHTDHSALKYLLAKKDAKARLLQWVLLLQEFGFDVIDTKGVENLAADHMSRLENPYENVLDPKEINETFPLETLSLVTFRGDSGAPWFADFVNYHAGNFIVKGIFGAPRAIINDRGTHFCNDQFKKVMRKYGVTHRLSTSYHLQTSGQVKEDPPPEVSMADNRTMAELLQAPTEGYEDTIVIPKIAANNFELKHGLINLVQNKQYFRHDKEDPHAHIRYFNKITSTMRDSLNSATGGIFLDNMPQECLKIIESKSKVRQSRAKAVVSKVGTSSSTPAVSSEVAELKDLVKALLLDKKNQSSAPVSSSTPAPVKAVEPNCVTCSGANFNQGQLHRPQVNQPPAYQAPIPQTQNVSNTDFESYIKANNAILRNMQSQGSGTLPSNTITNLKEELKGITNRSSVAYQGPTIPTPSKIVKQGTEVTKDQLQTQSTAPVRPPVIQSETQTPISEPIVAPVSASMPNVKSSIPYPSRHDNERRRDQANEQIEKFYEIFKYMSFEIRFTDALILMPKFASTLKALVRNKEKLSEMDRTSMNEHCSAVILNKLPRKIRDPGKFLIPCEFPGMDECLALADLGASINLMPFSVWEALSLPELTPTCMTLELADRSISKPIGIAKDVSFKVGVFHFPADFVVVDFKPDPRVSLNLERCFLKTCRGLIDVHKGELTLRIENEAITYKLDQTVRYSANYNQMTANKIDVICEEYSQEVLGFSDTTMSGNPTPHDDLIVSTTSPTLTPFGDSDFLLFEEDDAFLGLEDDPDSSKINLFYYDLEGDILLLEAIMNSEPLPPLPNHEQYLPSFKKELKFCEAKTIKSSVDELPEAELKDLPPHLEYAFLKGDNKLPIIIAKELGDEEKSALIKVLKSHKRAIAWELSDIQELKVCEAKTVKSSVDKPPEVELKDLPSHLEYAFLEGNKKLPVIIAKEL